MHPDKMRELQQAATGEHQPVAVAHIAQSEQQEEQAQQIPIDGPTPEEFERARQDEMRRAREEARNVAAAKGLVLGCTLVRWFPWPQDPEKQWVPIRSCSLDEIDAAHLFAHGKCVQFKRPDDTELFERWQSYYILHCAIRRGLAYQEGFHPDGSIKLRVVKAETNFDERMFSSPEDLRTSLRDKKMLDELVSYYFNHCAEAAPLSTYRRLLQKGEFEKLVLALKKKHGPIDLTEFSLEQLAAFIAFLVSSSRLGETETDTLD